MVKSKPNTETLFVVGTDTGIGKTVLSLLLMQFFLARGSNPFYLKPIQTGCKDPYDTDSDARFIYEQVGSLRGRDPAESVVYCFPQPKAPYFAARNEGSEIDLEVIRNAVEKKRLHHAPVILEGAGGLLVPVTSTQQVIDLVVQTNAGPILAARSALGTINHTLLSIESLRSRGLEPVGIVLLDPFDPPTSRAMIQENIKAIESFGGISVAGVLPRITDFSDPPRECFTILGRIFS